MEYFNLIYCRYVYNIQLEMQLSYIFILAYLFGFLHCLHLLLRIVSTVTACPARSSCGEHLVGGVVVASLTVEPRI